MYILSHCNIQDLGSGFFIPEIYFSYFIGLVQERRNSIAKALELCLSCTNPSICTLQLLVLSVHPSLCVYQISDASSLASMVLLQRNFCFLTLKYLLINFCFNYSNMVYITHNRHTENRSGVGVTKPISSVPLFSYFFSIAKKNRLTIENHVHIWQVSPQLSCGDTWRIWMWYK